MKTIKEHFKLPTQQEIGYTKCKRDVLELIDEMVKDLYEKRNIKDLCILQELKARITG